MNSEEVMITDVYGESIDENNDEGKPFCHQPTKHAMKLMIFAYRDSKETRQKRISALTE